MLLILLLCPIVKKSTLAVWNDRRMNKNYSFFDELCLKRPISGLFLCGANQKLIHNRLIQTLISSWPYLKDNKRQRRDQLWAVIHLWRYAFAEIQCINKILTNKSIRISWVYSYKNQALRFGDPIPVLLQIMEYS